MTRPTRQTAGGRAYLDLQNRARRENRPTQELLTLYVLERWLARMTASPYATTFVLKGGMLLAVFDARRPTADADPLAQHIASDEASVAANVRTIAQISLDEDDGVEFLIESLASQPIRDDAVYAGVRVSMDCRVSRSMVKLKLDINVGDPVTPEPQRIHLPSQRPNHPAIALLGYPIETVLAEKATTAIALGEANTRVRDYADVYTLTGKHTLERATMRTALYATATYRGVDLAPLSEVIGALPTLPSWLPSIPQPTRSRRHPSTRAPLRYRVGGNRVHRPTHTRSTSSCHLGPHNKTMDHDPSDAVIHGRG